MKAVRFVRRLAALFNIGPLRKLILRLGAHRYLVQTALAERLRQHRSLAVAGICIAACLYVLAAFAANLLFDSGPTAAHDSILRHRLSSPVADRSIVIVDIDERALATMAPLHGRWPWPRDVLAGAIERINAASARAVLFNVMLSDADRENPDADALMAYVAASATNVAYPMVRLAPENDALSKIPVGALPGAQSGSDTATVALLVPMFDGMQARMGVVNQMTDEDGIVRRYPVWWAEKDWALPSAALQTMRSAGMDTERLPGTISLNWRNKRGTYQRISLADLMSENAQTRRRVDAALQGAWVVVGASAPGIGQTKATPAAAVMDDNEILATALDDLLHGTYLRIPPAWLTLAVTLIAIFAVGALAITQGSASLVNNAFLGFQAVMSGVTLLCASYSNYLVDLSGPISVLLATFSAIKLVEALEQKNWRGLPSYFNPGRDIYQGQICLVGYLKNELSARQARNLRTGMEKAYGVKNVLCIDNLFGAEHLLREIGSNYACLVVFSSDEEPLQRLLSLQSRDSAMQFERHILPVAMDLHSERFTSTLMLWIVANACDLIGRGLPMWDPEPAPQ